jgi:CDGSH-type Zn-finger protein
MANTQQFTVVKKATVRVTHEHRFDEPADLCRCGKAEHETGAPVQVTEVSTSE